jgi:hypothetical protein
MFVEDMPVSLINGVTMPVFSPLDDSAPTALRKKGFSAGYALSSGRLLNAYPAEKKRDAAGVKES